MQIKHYKKYLYILVIFALFSCSNNEEEYAVVSESATHKQNTHVYETGRLLSVDKFPVDVKVPVMIVLLDQSRDEQNWVIMEAETYCESYGIAYIMPTYKQYPYVLKKHSSRYKDTNGNLHKIDLSQIAESYKDGFFLAKPDTTPVFMPWDTSSMHFDAPAAEAYFKFTYDNDIRKKKSYSEEDYVRMFPDMKSTVNEIYDFNNIVIKMRSRNFDFKLETGLSNHSVVECYYTFKYCIEKDKPEMIAYNMISFPLKVITGGKTIHINTPDTFIDKYKGIIKTDLKTKIKESTVFDLKPDKAGFMLNDKNVYFKRKDENFKITIIKND